MTTMTATAALAESQQAMIDARLDTIDRMLVGRVPRADRIAIVREVESQIHELLSDRDPQSIDCEDVLDVLRRLDPPEAFLANGGGDIESARLHHRAESPSLMAKPRQSIPRDGLIGGIAGLCSLGLVLLAPVIYLLADLVNSGEVILLALAALGLLGIAGSICGLVLSIRGRRQGILPIFGIVTASISLPIWMIGPVVMFLIG